MLLLFTLLGVNFFRTVNDGFIRWPQAETTRLAHYQTILLDIARDWQANPGGNLVVADAFYEPIDRDSLIRNLGRDPQARWVQTGLDVAGAIVLPVGGNGRLYVPEFAPIHPILLAAASIASEPLFRSETQPSYAMYELPEVQSSPAVPLDAPITFENIIKLEGYELLPLESGNILHLVTFWQVQDKLPNDLRAFIHAVNSAGDLIAQHDGFDAAPEELHPGDVVIQHHVINLAEENGQFELQVGLYALHNQRRLQPVGIQRDIVVLVDGMFVDGK
jgi:hypothetical protein